MLLLQEGSHWHSPNGLAAAGCWGRPPQQRLLYPHLAHLLAQQQSHHLLLGLEALLLWELLLLLPGCSRLPGGAFGH